MRQHDSDPLVSLGNVRTARAAAKSTPLSQRGVEFGPKVLASDDQVWMDLVEAPTDYGPRHPAKPKPLSDRMSVGE